MLPKRTPTALPGYDYSQPGAYFVTLCTQNRIPLFGQIDSQAAVLLSPAGKIVQQEWDALPRRFPFLNPETQKLVVIMPDHIHGILQITAGGASPSPTLHHILAAFKSITTIQVNRAYNTPGKKLWQRSTYEHVIRNQQDFDEAAEYILGNPGRWAARHLISPP